MVGKDLVPLEKALEALGPSAQSFARVFTHGHWADVWIQSILDVPFPPITPGLPVAATQEDVLTELMLEATR